MEPHKTNSMKSYCRACHKSFDIKEGWWAVKRHGEGTKHNTMFKSSDYNQNEDVPRGLNIPRALQNINIKHQFELTVEKKRQKAKVMLVTALANHGISERVHDCLNTLIPLIFDDSKVAKGWNMGQTKASNILTYGIDPDLREKLVLLLRSRFFSMNFDESTICHHQLLALNVSTWNDEGKIFKANLDMIEVTEGTTGREVGDY